MTNGLVFSYKIQAEGPEGEVMISLDSIALNVPVPDSLFIMPADAVPLPDELQPGGRNSD
jgi:hypothetical protein